MGGNGGPIRSRPALLYMHGDDRHKIGKALTLGVDCQNALAGACAGGK
jgi:hypothetical protein